MNIKTILLFFCAFLLVYACKQQAGTDARHPGSERIPPVSHEIPVDVAKKYVQNYIDSNTRRLAPLPGDTIHKFRYNTQCVWFSREELDTLMAILHRDGGDGIRFYFASYDPSYENDTTMPPVYWGKNTLIMASTKRDSLGYQRDYYDTTAGPLRQRGFLRGIAEGMNAFNHGEVCPRPPDCNSIGATLIEPLLLRKK
ncbi:MAG TPA: hypothetical protein VM802_20150 [Chitinophaga sp.]|uniref:hypothetical protein n=1 Tax=Chitinophaga sp. TaxID=1869181 RepID=UPI002B6477DA|nr:hypothetical protein [Chitinophaga sp.]HVI47201.1 hypothetical protein [Chitinophaga sp.]